jgi:hypothetical protein
MALVDIDSPTAFTISACSGCSSSGALSRQPHDDRRAGGDIADYRIRWLGTNLAAMFGTPRTGTGIEAMTSVGERSSVLPQYRIVIDTGIPAYYATEVELSQRGVVAQ